MIDASQILKASGVSTPISVVAPANLAKHQKAASPMAKAIIKAQGFEAAPLSWVAIPNAKGETQEIWVGAPASDADPFALGSLSSRLPAGHYRFTGEHDANDLVALGWCLELYKYDPYRVTTIKATTLHHENQKPVIAAANASFAVRDFINTPANLFGPDELEAAARHIAGRHKVKFTAIKGKTLEKQFPLIQIVGAASPRAPRLIDFTWGSAKAPKVTLVGKGVCFDTGGLDIKPSAGMLMMKKDMGGAATVLGLAQMIMEAKINIRLRVLIPAVENSIAGNAFRPGDVFKTRKGLTVEIGNTDAEGRLVLCEALALADEEAPDLLIDMATLTGAARVALGPDLPPFYTDDSSLAASIASHAQAQNDPLWQLPFWKPYYNLIETPIADLNNAGAGGFAGSITAALFLKRFVEKAKAYVHFDIYGWVPTAKPGRPKGGEAQGMRALFAMIQERYAK